MREFLLNSLSFNTEKLIKFFYNLDQKNIRISKSYIVYLNNEKLEVPYRIYYREPTTLEVQQLSEVEMQFVYCIFTRHSDGFVREKYLKKILEIDQYWCTPYVFLLLGEYVLELIETIENSIKRDKSLSNNLIAFASENTQCFQLISHKMTSYWNCYFRRTLYKNLSDYPGYKILTKIKNELNSISKE